MIYTSSGNNFYVFCATQYLVLLSFQKQLELNIVTMSYKEGEITELQQKIESQNEVSIDEAVVAPAPLYNQYVSYLFYFFPNIVFYLIYG